MNIVIAAIIGGLILALIVSLTLVGELKTVRHERAAQNYIRQNSFKLTSSRDLFLYKKLEKTAKPQNNQQKQLSECGYLFIIFGGH